MGSLYILFALSVFGICMTTGIFVDMLSFSSVVVRKLFVKYDIGNSKPPATVIFGVVGMVIGFLWPFLLFSLLCYFVVIIPLARLIDNFPYTISVKKREE